MNGEGRMDCRDQAGRSPISMPVVQVGWPSPGGAKAQTRGKTDFQPASPTLLTGARLAGSQSFGPCDCGGR